MENYNGQSSVASGPVSSPNVNPYLSQPTYIQPTYIQPTYIQPTYGSTSSGGSSTPSPEAVSAATGIDPSELANILYGKPLPVFIGGLARIGCRIVEGPVFDKVQGTNGQLVDAVSMIVVAARPVNPNGTRTIREVSFNGIPVWNSTVGALIQGLTIRMNTGTFAQMPDAMSVAAYGSRACAYRPNITIAIEKLSLEKYDDKIPFVSCVVADSTYGDPDEGIALSDALGALIEYAGFTPAEYAVTGVTGSVQAMILAEQTALMPFLQSLRKLYPQWNILTDDKLRVVEKGATTIDAVINSSKVTANGSNPIVFSRGDPMQVPAELNYSFIDPARDYEPNTVTCMQDRVPVPATLSTQSDSATLPIVTSSQDAIAQVYYAGYNAEVARESGSIKAMPSLYGIEPGDIVFYDVNRPRTHRARQVARNLAWNADVATEGFLTCVFSADATMFVLAADALMYRSSGGSTVLSSNSDGVIATSICAANGIYVAGGVDAENSLMPAIQTSQDAISWTKQTFPTLGSDVGGEFHGPVNSIIWDGSQFVAVGPWIGVGGVGGAGQGSFVATSDDAETWTIDKPSVMDSYTLSDVVFADGKYVAVGFKASNGNTGLFYSDDLEVWSRTADDTIGTFKAVTHDGTKFIAVGVDGAIATSGNGASWTSINSGTGTVTYYDVTAFDGLIVAVGDDGADIAIILSENNGADWTDATFVPPTGGLFGMRGVAVNAGLWLTSGYPLMRSTDGRNWDALEVDNIGSFGITAAA